MPRDNETWLGTQEAAKELGITTRTLYRLIDEGQIAAYKLGRVLRIRRADIASYLDTCRVQPGDLKHLYPPRVDDGDETTEG